MALIGLIIPNAQRPWHNNCLISSRTSLVHSPPASAMVHIEMIDSDEAELDPQATSKSAAPVVELVMKSAEEVMLRRSWAIAQVSLVANMANLGHVSVETWQSRFGDIDEIMFGSDFWSGMVRLLASQKNNIQSWGPPMLAIFTQPLNFSKASAAKPFSFEHNTFGDSEYPCLVWRSSPTTYVMKCLYMLWFDTRHWTVHGSWITIWEKQ